MLVRSTANHDKRAGAKDRIMVAAENLFAGQGYAATSIAQIAQSAAANRALLYYYFRDKRDLYWAIMERGLREVLRLLDDVAQAPGGPWERLERFVRAYYELLVTHENVARMVFREMTGSCEELGLPIDNYLREVIKRMGGIVDEGLRSGEFGGLDPELTAFSLFGMIHVFFTQRLVTGRGFPADVVVAHTLRFFRHGANAQDGPGVGRASKRAPRRSPEKSMRQVRGAHRFRHSDCGAKRST
jgi:AcrR family transcriptional regulator